MSAVYVVRYVFLNSKKYICNIYGNRNLKSTPVLGGVSKSQVEELVLYTVASNVALIVG